MILRRLKDSDERTFYRAYQEWDPDMAKHWFSCYDSSMSYKDLLQKLEDEHNGVNLPENFVSCTVLYGFVKERPTPRNKSQVRVSLVGDWIVGRLSIRHRLSEFTKVYGGHIGYAVTEKYRGYGYGYEMLKQALPKCVELGIKEALLTVNADNAPSIATIRKCGGKFVDSFYDNAHNRITKRYQIDL